MRIDESVAAKERLRSDPVLIGTIARAADALASAYHDKAKSLWFGNGGSAADAQHLAAELVGRFRIDREALPAIALSANTSVVTALANDFAVAEVFSRQIEAFGRPGDVAVGISTSGRSANVARGLEAARRNGLSTIALTGGDGGDLVELADVCVIVPASDTARIQEMHILVGHILCELVEIDLTGR